MSSNNEAEKLDGDRHVVAYIIAILAIPVILVLWYIGGRFAMSGGAWLYGQDEGQQPVAPGTVGDMFGAVNALFSGLAFWGVTVALIINAYEYRLARKARQEDLEEQKNIVKAQHDVAESQRLVARSGEAFRYWQALGRHGVIEGLLAIPRVHSIVLRRHKETIFNDKGAAMGPFLDSRAESEVRVEGNRLPRRYLYDNGNFNTRLFEEDVNACIDALVGIQPSIDAGIYHLSDLLDKVIPRACLMLASIASARRTQAAERRLRVFAAGLRKMERSKGSDNKTWSEIKEVEYQLDEVLYSGINPNRNSDRLKAIQVLQQRLLDLQA